MRHARRNALVFATLAAVPGCITVNSPLFPGPMVIDRACPQVAARGAPDWRSAPDTTPTAPMPEPAPVMVPRLDPPVEMGPVGPTSGGGRARRLMAGE